MIDIQLTKDSEDVKCTAAFVYLSLASKRLIVGTGFKSTPSAALISLMEKQRFYKLASAVSPTAQHSASYFTKNNEANYKKEFILMFNLGKDLVYLYESSSPTKQQMINLLQRYHERANKLYFNALGTFVKPFSELRLFLERQITELSMGDSSAKTIVSRRPNL